MSDNFSAIQCPACEKEMAEVFIPSEGITIDICLDGCGGIYFDNREFEHFDEQHEKIDEIIKAVENKTFKPVNSTLPRVCPVCGAKMVKTYASPKNEIAIDTCYSCGGKFLDNCELQKIRELYQSEAEKSEETTQMIDNIYGEALQKIYVEQATLKTKRSSLKRLFDKMLGI